MALGKPSITTPAALQLQSIQQTIANIRERFRLTDEAISQFEAKTNASINNASKQGRDFQADITRLERLIAAIVIDADDGGVSLSGTFAVSGDVSQGDPVRLVSAGAVARIDPDDLDACAGYLGIASSSSTSGSVNVTFVGVVEIPSGAFIAGRPLYAVSGGGVTHNPAGNPLQVGAAASATSIVVGGNAGQVVLQNPVDGDTGDNYLPITYALAQSMIDTSPGGVLPVVTGEVPPVLVYFDDGSLLYSGVS